MGFLETFACVLGAVAAIAKAIKCMFFKPSRSTTPSSVKATQSVIVVLPSSVVIAPVILDEEIRDLLQIPSAMKRGFAKPKLYVPGQGVVGTKFFVGQAADSLLFEADRPFKCTICGMGRFFGGYFADRWYCAQDLHRVLEQLASGEGHPLWPSRATTAHGWHEFQCTGDAQTPDARRRDPILERLGIFAERLVPPPASQFERYLIDFECQSCSLPMEIKSHMAGRLVRCVECDELVRVPAYKSAWKKWAAARLAT